jgi:hypothetical protein
VTLGQVLPELGPPFRGALDLLANFSQVAHVN